MSLSVLGRQGIPPQEGFLCQQTKETEKAAGKKDENKQLEISVLSQSMECNSGVKIIVKMINIKRLEYSIMKYLAIKRNGGTNCLLIQPHGWIAKNIMLTIREFLLYDSIYRMF